LRVSQKLGGEEGRPERAVLGGAPGKRGFVHVCFPQKWFKNLHKLNLTV
jgi:hypothetical protein